MLTAFPDGYVRLILGVEVHPGMVVIFPNGLHLTVMGVHRNPTTVVIQGGGGRSQPRTPRTQITVGVGEAVPVLVA